MLILCVMVNFRCHLAGEVLFMDVSVRVFLEENGM